MTRSRHQRALEKLQAVKATKRFQSAQARFEKDGGSVITETTFGDSKSSEEQDIEHSNEDLPVVQQVPDLPVVQQVPELQVVQQVPDLQVVQQVPDLPVVQQVPDSPARSRVDEDEAHQVDKVENFPKEGTNNTVDSRHDGMNSPKAHQKSYDGDKTPKSKTMSRIVRKEETTPPRRFDIVDDERPSKADKNSKASLRKSSKGRKSRRDQRSKRSRIVRIKERQIDDDTSTVDSQLECFLSEERSEGGVASALDHIFDYFNAMDDILSVDDSGSERTERTERTEESYLNTPMFESFFSSKSKGGILKDVEELFIDRLSCGPSIPECQGLGTRTFSYPDDESTGSGRKESREKGKTHATRSMRSTRKPASKEIDTPSVDLNTLVPEDGTETETLTTNGESLSSKVDGSFTTSAYDTDKENDKSTSFESNEGADWRNACNVAGCFEESTEADDEDREGKNDRIRDLLHRAKLRAEKATKDFKGDASSLFSMQTSLLDGQSITSTVMSSLRDAGRNIRGDVTATDSTDCGTALTAGKGPLTVDTKPVTQEPPASNDALDSSKNDTSTEMYAPAYPLKPSSSFYSVDTRMSQKEIPESAFHKALGKLRDDTVLATKRLQEFQDNLAALDFASGGNVSIPEKVKQVITCSPDSAKVPPLVDEPVAQEPVEQEPVARAPVTREPVAQEPTEATAVERLKDVFSCSEVGRVESTVAKDGENIAVETTGETDELVNDSLTITFAGDMVETPCEKECFDDVVKPAVEGDSESRSVETKDTSRSSTEDEADNEKPEDYVCEPMPVNKSIDCQEETPSQPQSTQDPPLEATESKSPKKWGKLRRMSKLVRPFFATKKHQAKRTLPSNSQAPVALVYDSDDIRNTSTDSGVKSLESQVSPDQNTSNSSRADSAASPFDPSLSMKAKREAWRSTKVDEFDEIISTKARDDDWDHMFPAFFPSDATDAASKASF